MQSKEIGQLGEKIAEKHLIKKGFSILDKNYPFSIPGSPQLAEIDLIAKKDGSISFVEVKTSLEESLKQAFSPEDRVNFWKRKKIRQAAESWLNKNKIPLDSKWQVDVMSVTIDAQEKKARIRLFPNVQ